MAISFEKIMEDRISLRNMIPNKPLNKEQKGKIIKAFKLSPSWVNAQTNSLILIESKDIKKKIREITGQQHIEDCSLFVIILGDFHKLNKMWELQNLKTLTHDEVMSDITVSIAMHDGGIIGSSIMNMVGSMGLVTVPIGHIRMESVEPQVREVLKLPKDAFIVMGVCIGYENKGIPRSERPARMSEDMDVYYEEYNPNLLNHDNVAAYDKIYEDSLRKNKWTSMTHNFWFEFSGAVKK